VGDGGYRRGGPLTSARVFDDANNAYLAQWLDTDADLWDGSPGWNNHVAACRAAAERLRAMPLTTPRPPGKVDAQPKTDTP
jgi:hypothetical protein